MKPAPTARAATNGAEAVTKTDLVTDLVAPVLVINENLSSLVAARRHALDSLAEQGILARHAYA